MQLNKYFIIQEYVPKKVYETYGAAFCMRFVNPVILQADVWLKELLTQHFGQEVTVSINTWPFGGNLQYRGFRDPSCKTGKWTSAHRMAMASDHSFHVKSTGKAIAIKDVYNLIMQHEQQLLTMGITRIENPEKTPNWLHWDCIYTGLDHIKIVDP